ncbi:MAG: GNAT family N-acetyltransferase [Acidovorax sp.]|nr:GNAT family N-acetyltransferase [Acidovorax sp.]
MADHGNVPTILAAWLANKTPENMAAWISAPGAAAWGAYRAETMVGFALLTHATLALCYVVPDALHQGVGQALLAEAEAHARQAGLAALGLASTRTAEAFYCRNGYEPAGALQSWAGLQAQPMRKVL